MPEGTLLAAGAGEGRGRAWPELWGFAALGSQEGSSVAHQPVVSTVGWSSLGCDLGLKGSFGSLPLRLGIHTETRAHIAGFSGLAFPLYLMLLGTRRVADGTDALFLTSKPRFFLSLQWFQVLAPEITKKISRGAAVLHNNLRA